MNARSLSLSKFKRHENFILHQIGSGASINCDCRLYFNGSSRVCKLSFWIWRRFFLRNVLFARESDIAAIPGSFYLHDLSRNKTFF